MRAVLRLVKESPEGERAVEIVHSLLIGRAPTANFQIKSNSVSRWHALIRRCEPGMAGGSSGYQILDLGSQNGTYVDGKKVQSPTRLPAHSIVRIGDQRLEFQVYTDSSSDTILTRPGDTAPLQERVAILVCDVRGLNALSERLGLERLSATLGAWFRRIATVVSETGGVVERFLGDRVLAYWAHAGMIATAVPGSTAVIDGRSECQAALAAARRIATEADGMERWPDGSAFRVGVAVHCGMAAFDRGSAQEKVTPTLMGDVVEEALRLEADCRDSGVRVVWSDAVSKLVDPIADAKPLGDLKLSETTPATHVFGV